MRDQSLFIVRGGGGAKGAVDIDHMVFRKLGEGVARKRQRILGVITWFSEKWGGREGAKGWGLHGLKKIGGEGGRCGC